MLYFPFDDDQLGELDELAASRVLDTYYALERFGSASFRARSLRAQASCEWFRRGSGSWKHDGEKNGRSIAVPAGSSIERNCNGFLRVFS